MRLIETTLHRLNRFISILAVLFVSITVSGQVSIGGVVNSYYSVSGIGASSVTCSGVDVSDLSPGDKVMLIQMTGGDFWSYSPTDGDGLALTDGTLNVGNYELLSVLSANNTTKVVAFTANLLKSYDAGERIQLVKIYEAKEIQVESEVTAKAWDGTTGGIVAIVSLGKLTLNADINASEQGFRGGNILSYSGGCLPAAVEDSMYFDDGTLNRGGEKGEGGMKLSFGKSIGPGKHYLGGGGGVGRFGGGAGGSNFRIGGNGGFQIDDGCSMVKKAKGGASLEDAITNHEQVFLGGGGGSSAQGGGFVATQGGNGGGIILLLCDTLVGNGFNIDAFGQAVVGTATAGGGGGGAGGTILFDVETIQSSINLNLTGGKGGDIDDANCTGAGGGGAGGVLFHNKSSLPSSLNPTLGGGTFGTNGTCTGGSDVSAGGNGQVLHNLQLVLNGFTFNAITGNDIICEGQQPNEIIGTTPKGDNPVYQWYESDDSLAWVAISGAQSINYQPPVLTQTKWYTREVTLDGVTDRAIPAKVLVYDAISNNILTLRDTLCYDTEPGLLTASAPTGGNSSFIYKWQSSEDQAEWTNRGSEVQITETNSLTTDTYYRRIVTSADVCVDTSLIDTLTVLPAITDNGFINGLDTTVCKGLDAGTIYGRQPNGGKLGDYSYQWQQSSDNSVYSNISGAEGIHYSPGIPVETLYFKRIVFSGTGNLCSDTTNSYKLITLLDPIDNNEITGDATQYTCFGSSITLNGSTPTGGNGQYQYSWQSSADGSAWADEEGTVINYPSDDLIDPTYFRRIVTSGDESKCVDTSSTVFVELYALPTGDIISKMDTICSGNEVTVQYINVTGAAPWQISIGETTELHSQTIEAVNAPEGSLNAFALTETTEIKILRLQDANNCLADLTLNSGVHNVMVYSNPIPDAGEDFDNCGLNFSLNATLSTANEAGIGIWENTDAIFDDETNPNTGVSMNSYGVHTFRWTETNWECSDFDDVVITLFEQPVNVNAGEDQELAYVFQTNLDAEVPALQPDGGGGVWSFIEGAGDIADVNDAKSEVDMGDGNVGNYTLQWKIFNGPVCDSISDEVSIIIKDLKISNGFSPNGDGINDYFNINVPGDNLVTLTILDRNGNRVKVLSGTEAEDVSWDGTNESGQQVPSDTYYYILEEDGRSRNGFIDIRR